MKYPEFLRGDLVEELHGVKVADPYRWLEDPQSPDTRAFITAQNTLSEEYISNFPHTDLYRESLTRTFDYERYGVPFRCGNRWYYSYNEGLSPQNVYYVVEGDAIDSPGKGIVFFDPNILSEDGTLALNTHHWSNDGSLYSYALSQSGSDWCYAQIRNVATGKDYPEKLEWLKSTRLSFTHDNKGLFYTRFPEPASSTDAGTETGINKDAMVYYHFIGTAQSEDVLIYSDPNNPDYRFGVAVTFDGNWIIMTISKDTAPINKLWVAKLNGKGLPANGKFEWIKISDDFNSGLDYVAKNANVFYFWSNHEAPRGKIVRYDLDKPEEGFVTIVPEQPHAVLEDASLTNEKHLVLGYLHNVQSKLLVVSLDALENQISRKDSTEGNFIGMNDVAHALFKHVKGDFHENDTTVAQNDHWIGIPNARELELPVGCSVYTISSRRDDPRVFIYCTGFTFAARIYKFTFHSSETSRRNENPNIAKGDAVQGPQNLYGELSVWRETIVKGFDPDRWVAEQVWVANPNDGVKIPMYIVRDKSLVKTGNSFCLLSGYGGFNISLLPSFSGSVATMLTHSGGLYCVANIRGGGEFGEDWHKAAIREKRPVAFADFEECGRYLIREGWTSNEKLVCQGGSNGGALVGAVMNRTGNEIFGAGIAEVGVLDLLRYHLFTVGNAWKADYGDPDVKEDFEFIYKWSPYHNIRDGKDFQYPALLCTTADHDDRVVPLHSFKFIAALQHAAGKTNRAPLLLRHHLKAGHGAGKPIKKIIEEECEQFAFMMTATKTPFVLKS